MCRTDKVAIAAPMHHQHAPAASSFIEDTQSLSSPAQQEEPAAIWKTRQVKRENVKVADMQQVNGQVPQRQGTVVQLRELAQCPSPSAARMGTMFFAASAPAVQAHGTMVPAQEYSLSMGAPTAVIMCQVSPAHAQAVAGQGVQWVQALQVRPGQILVQAAPMSQVAQQSQAPCMPSRQQVQAIHHAEEAHHLPQPILEEEEVAPQPPSSLEAPAQQEFEGTHEHQAPQKSQRRKRRARGGSKAGAGAAGSAPSSCTLTPNSTPSHDEHDELPAVEEEASPQSDENGMEVRESLTDALEAGGEEREKALCQLRGTMLNRSLEVIGCREVQAAFQELDRKVASELLTELRGHVFTLIKSPYGNYVLQKVIEVMSPQQVSFIPEELKGSVLAVAKHRYGCRVLCRLLEHTTDHSTGLADCMDELLLQAEELCRHPFAHHVTQSVLEHGLPQHRHRMCQALHADLIRNASDRHASFVMEAALGNCSPDDQEELGHALVHAGQKDAGILALAQTRFGSHVVRALLKSPGAMRSMATDGLQNQAENLWETKYGRRLLQELGMAPAKAVVAAAAAA